MRACTYSLLLCSLILSASSQPTQKKTAKPDKAVIAGPNGTDNIGKDQVGKVKENKGAGEGKEKKFESEAKGEDEAKEKVEEASKPKIKPVEPGGTMDLAKFEPVDESEAKGEDEAKEKEFPTLSVEPGDKTVTIEKEEEAHNMPMVPGGVMCEVKADGLEHCQDDDSSWIMEDGEKVKGSEKSIASESKDANGGDDEAQKMIALAMEMIEEQLHLLQNVQILLNKGENKKSKENGEPKGEEGTDEDPGEADNQLKPETEEGDIKVTNMAPSAAGLKIEIPPSSAKGKAEKNEEEEEGKAAPNGTANKGLGFPLPGKGCGYYNCLKGWIGPRG